MLLEDMGSVAIVTDSEGCALVTVESSSLYQNALLKNT